MKKREGLAGVVKVEKAPHLRGLNSGPAPWHATEVRWLELGGGGDGRRDWEGRHPASLGDAYHNGGAQRYEGKDFCAS